MPVMRPEADQKSCLKMASDRRLSCCRVAAGAGGSQARSECRRDVRVAHFKPGNFTPVLALQSHAAGNHLLAVRWERCLEDTQIKA